MSRINKRTAVMTLLVLLLASSAWAVRGVAKVENTAHNFAYSTAPSLQWFSDNVDQTCVFCHTPHGGVTTGPLWNHSMPDATSFTHYNSVTLSTYLRGLSVSRKVNDESLVCMACHDGSVAVDHLLNPPNSLNGAAPTLFYDKTEVFIVGTTTPNARIGATMANPTTLSGDLTDDHPISFSYSQVLGDPMYSGGGSKDGELRDIGTVSDSTTALGRGVRFFTADNNVECSSCHDPHVDYTAAGQAAYEPFLITPNTGSALCLACHNK